MAKLKRSTFGRTSARSMRRKATVRRKRKKGSKTPMPYYYYNQ